MNSTRKNPYIGPRTYQRNEGHLFFGREREARDLIALVASEQLVVFYAQSGAGKSSIVNTRLIPNLEGKGFEVLPVGRVSGDTAAGTDFDNIYIYNLLRSLEQHETDPAGLAKMSLSHFLVHLNMDEKGFFYDPSPAEATAGGNDLTIMKRALVIDQFEELFSTHPEAWEKREVFFQQLAQAMQDDPHLWVVLVMREDYIAALDPYAHYLSGGLRVRYYMQRLGREAALTAVKSPVEEFRPYAEGVAEKLIDDLCSIKVQKPDGTLDVQPGQYVEPVQLQVVCYGLWENLPPEGTQITEKDLQDVGDVNQSLGKYYDRRVNDVARVKNVRERLIREWFEKKLIAAGGIRNMVLREREKKSGELDDEVIQALQSDLVRSEKRGGATWYELTHDRLVEPILERNKIWFNENLSPLQRQAALWKDQGQNESWLLRDKALVEVEEWAKEHRDELTDVEKDFLAACQRAQEQIEERNAAERRRLEMANKLAEEQARSAKRARIFNVVAGILIVIAIYFSISAYQAQKKAESSQRDAEMAAEEAVAAKEDAQEQANKARSSDLILSAQDNVSQPDLAALLKIEAYRYNDDSRSRRSLLFTLQEYGGLQSFWNQSADQILLSPDGKTAATRDKDGITLWDLNSREKLNKEPINGHSNPVYPTAFSPDGRYLASGSKDSSVVFWAMESQQSPQALTKPLKEHTAWVDAVAFSPDGSILASASDDYAVILWDASDPKEPRKLSTLSGHTQWIASVAFSSDGNTLASGSADYTVILWNVSDPKKPRKIGTPLAAPGNIFSVAISKDDSILAVGSGEGSFTLWNVSDPKNPVQLSQTYNYGENPSGVYALAFSPSDDRLLAVGGGNSIGLWDISDPKNPVMFGEEPITKFSEGESPFSNGYIYSVAFSADRKTLASSSSNFLILWDVSNPEKPAELASRSIGSSGLTINSIAFNPADGTKLVTGGMDGSITYWDVSDRTKPVQIGAPQKGHPGQPTGMGFNADGSILSSYGDDGTVLLNAVTPSLLGRGSIYPVEGDRIQVVQYFDGETGKDMIELLGTTDTGRDINAKIQGTYVAMGPTSQTLVYTTLDKNGKSNINLWDSTAGKPVKTDIAGSFLGYSRDGKLLAYQNVDSDENTFITLIDTANGSSIVNRLKGEYISITPDDNTLLYHSLDENSEYFIAGWDIRANQPMGLHTRGRYQAMSTDGKSLVSLAQDDKGDRFLGLVATDSGEQIGKPVKVPYDGDLYNIYLANKTIFYQAYDSEAGNNINLLDITTGNTDSIPTSEGGISLSPDKKTLIYHTYDFDTGLNSINLLDLETGLPIGEPWVGTFSMFVPDSNTLVYNIYDTYSGSNSLSLLDMTSGLPIGAPQAGSYTALSPDGRVLVYQSYDSLSLLDVTTGLAIGSTSGGNSFLGFSADGNVIYQRNDAVGLFDKTTGRILSEMVIKGTNLTFQPGGNILATTDTDNGFIYLWDITKSNALGAPLEKLSEPVLSTTLAPNGKTLAIITEGGITLQDLDVPETSGQPFSHHVGGVRSVIFDPGGKTLLSVGEDGKSILWDAAKRSMIGSPITGVVRGFSPDGSILVVADEQKQITRFMDVKTSSFTGNLFAGTGTTFSPDGTILVVSDSSNNRSVILNLNTLEQIGVSVQGASVRFSPKGDFLAISDGSYTSFWFRDSTALAPIGEALYGYDPIFSADGKFMWTQNSGGYSTAWNLTASKIEPIRGVTDIYGAGMDFSPDGKFLVIIDDLIYNDNDDDDDNLTLWNLTTLRKNSPDVIGNDPVFSPGGKYLAASDGYYIRLLDLAAQKQLDMSLEGIDPVFSSDDKYLAVSNGDNVSVWDLASMAKMDILIQGTDPVFSPDNKFLAVNVSSEEETGTALWDLTARKNIPLIGTNAGFTSDSRYFVNTSTVFDLLALQPILEDEAGNYSVENNGNILAIYGSKGVVLWDAGGKTLSQPLPGHSGNITKSMFSPDGGILASMASDGIVLTNVLTGEKLGETIPGTSMAFDPNGKAIAVSAGANETVLWDIADVDSFKPVFEKPLPGDTGMFSPDGSILTTTNAEEKSTNLWDTSTWEKVSDIPGIYSFFSEDGNKLAVIKPGSGGGDRAQSSTITIWDLKSQSETGKITLEKPCSTDNPCNSVAFSSDGKYLAYNQDINPNDSMIDTFLWDLENQETVKLGAPIKTVSGISDLSFVFGGRFGYMLVIEGTAGSFTIWEIPSGIQISEPVRGEFQTQVSAAGRDALIYISENTRDLILWTYAPEEWADQMCENVGRNFTLAEWKQFFKTDLYRKTCTQWP